LTERAPSEEGRVRRARARFLRDLPFAPDPFQVEAIDAFDEGNSVLVSAPTGSGKTLVAAYAVDQALAADTKAFYTTPLKALSNQKYAELAERHGHEAVGLLTGDTSLRPRAPIVVMTTEVLRNMLLARSDLLEGLSTVVLDEVHYLQDPYRGGVWEEVLVMSPPEVRFVCLSATVANASELGGWLRSVRGPTTVVVERRRPITLRHHFAFRRREDAEPTLLPLLVNGRASPEGLRVDQSVRRTGYIRRTANFGPRGSGRGPLPFRTPRRTELLDLLDDEDLLPAIVFIFSRSACDEAVRQVLRDGVHLTGRAERVEIRRIVEQRTAGLQDEDLAVLGYAEWLEGLEAGVAAHHAGLIPAYRETVEALFAAGLLRAVFATETLSLGINMPARSVVIERFTKFGGSGRATLTSGEYAQLTGRAGRRGLDAEGHAVVLWSAETTLADVARVATAPPPDLRSAFRPTYNLCVNLAQRFDRAAAEQILRSSFAQWQADAAAAAAGRPPHSDVLVDHLERRLAVLDSLGYVRGWELLAPGLALRHLYHEADLVIAEALAAGVLDGAEPSVLAGVLSGLVFEPRRQRRDLSHGRRRGSPRGVEPGGVRRRHRRGTRNDRLGEQRRQELAQRTEALFSRGELVRSLEEGFGVPRTRPVEAGLGTAVCAWARGASLATVLDVAEQEGGTLAPGDFVRTLKQLADLVGQVALVATHPGTAHAASEAVELLVRSVVAPYAPSAIGGTAQL
jgi:superfamily II RNA helicase